MVVTAEPEEELARAELANRVATSIAERGPPSEAALLGYLQARPPGIAKLQADGGYAKQGGRNQRHREKQQNEQAGQEHADDQERQANWAPRQEHAGRQPRREENHHTVRSHVGGPDRRLSEVRHKVNQANHSRGRRRP